MLFYTKTGVAIDLDTQPPSLDIGYERDEMVLAPIFEDDRVLPVLTTVATDMGSFDFKANHSFATGDAAMVFADALTSPDRYQLGEPGDPQAVPRPRKDGRIIVTKVDDPPEGIFEHLEYLLVGNEERKRYFFGTDTTLGLHVEWGGNTLPRSVALGYKRKELALVPLMERETYVDQRSGKEYTPAQVAALIDADTLLGTDGKEYATPGGSTPADAKKVQELADKGLFIKAKDIRLASLIATAGLGSTVSDLPGTNVGVGQTFATGPAATLLSTHPGIRSVLGPSLISDYDQVARVDLGKSPSNDLLLVMADVYAYIVARATDPNAPDATAIALQGRLNGLDSARPMTGQTVYAFAGNALTSSAIPNSPNYAGPNAFTNLTAYYADLNSSVAALQAALDPSVGAITFAGNTLTTPSDKDPVRVLFAQEASRKKALDESVGVAPVLSDAVEYYIQQFYED